MQISFVIPLFNQLALTHACLASLRASLPAGLACEIVLVDDGSTDGTRTWLAAQRDPDVRVLLNEKNLGYAAANNRGAALAQGTLLVLLNNDVVLAPGWLEPLLAAHRRLGPRTGVIGNVQRDAHTGVVDHAGIVINLKAKPEHVRTLPPRWVRFLAPVRRVPAVTGACALIERSLWERLGGFDETFINGGEDVDLCFRARAAGRVNAVALRSIIRHHVSASAGRKLRDEQNSRRLARKWRSELEAFAHRRWCWHHLERHWTTPHDAADRLAAGAALAFALHLRRTAPQIAVAGMRAAMDHELARWEKLLDP